MFKINVIFIVILNVFLVSGTILSAVVNAQDYQDSPFGFHPGNANNYQYILDLGASWSREGAYLIWEWVDVNRDGHFRFKDATAPPKPGIPNSDGTVDYDAELSNVPDNIIIVKNICPFRKGGEFASEEEKQHYYNFVKAAVERYDGDDDLGCPQSFPDGYFVGDNDHPSQRLVDRLKTNPVKYWQVCNQVFDACADDCPDTYAQKFAEVQRLTYLAVKEADTTAQVLIAGDSYMTEYPAVFTELNGKYLDIVDLHRFGDESLYNPEKHLDYIKNALVDAGYNLKSTRFWITETGTYSGDPVPGEIGIGVDHPFQNEKQQARGLLKIYVSAFSHGIEKVFWAWNIMEGFQKDGSIFDYTGLIYDGYEWTGNSRNDPNGKYSNDPADILYDQGADVKKLAYYTYKFMIDKLENGNWDNITTVLNGANNTYAYKFNKQGNSIWILWWDWYCDRDYSIGDTISIDLFVGNADSVIITESIPNADSGDEIQEYDYPVFFFTHTEKVNYEKAAITLGKEPVYVELVSSITSVENQGESSAYRPDIYLSSYPNPFNSQTRIRYNLDKSSNITLKIYNISGQEIAALVNEFKTAGKHEIIWQSKGLPSGIYFYELKAGDYSETKKLILKK